MSRRNQGMTLTEILVVVAILSILIILSIFTWKVQLAKGHDAKRKDDLKRIRIAFEEYYNDHDCYPSLEILNNCGGDDLQPYLKIIPCDPISQQPYVYIFDQDPAYADCGQNFRILTHLEYSSDPDIAALGCDHDYYCGWEITAAELSEDSGFNYGVSSTNVPVANADPESASGFAPGEWACTPSGDCNTYARPEDCPLTFANPDECTSYCPTSSPEERCPY